VLRQLGDAVLHALGLGGGPGAGDGGAGTGLGDGLGHRADRELTRAQDGEQRRARGLGALRGGLGRVVTDLADVGGGRKLHSHDDHSSAGDESCSRRKDW
jgi:hypothetical protein